jgi:hypothetical protein
VLLAVITLVLVALLFDFINGFHDAANSIATVVSTRVRRARPPAATERGSSARRRRAFSRPMSAAHPRRSHVAAPFALRSRSRHSGHVVHSTTVVQLGCPRQSPHSGFGSPRSSWAT